MLLIHVALENIGAFGWRRAAVSGTAGCRSAGNCGGISSVGGSVVLENSGASVGVVLLSAVLLVVVVRENRGESVGSVAGSVVLEPVVLLVGVVLL